MLVPLLKLMPIDPLLAEQRAAGIVIRRANAHELTKVRDFAQRVFSIGWADEIGIGFSRRPISVYIAIENGVIVGFSAYECTRRAFFGPTGVSPDHRGRGIGRALLLAALWGLREMGYAYAIIGGAGPTDFYQRECGATVIPDSVPGVYADPLK